MALDRTVDSTGNPLPYPPDDNQWPTPLGPELGGAPADPLAPDAPPDPAPTPTTPPPTTTTTPTPNTPSWFDSFAPSQYAPFGETFTATPRPSYLQGEYVAPTWQGGDFRAPEKPLALQKEFAAPTWDEVRSDPGYLSGLNAGVSAREASAAAKGSILSGGQQKALTRFGQDYGNGFYGDVYNRAMATRQQQGNEYNQDYGNAFNAYKERYGQFMDSANLSAQARGINESAFQNDSANNLNQYNARYRAYQDNISNDIASRGQGLTALALARPV